MNGKMNSSYFMSRKEKIKYTGHKVSKNMVLSEQKEEFPLWSYLSVG